MVDRMKDRFDFWIVTRDHDGTLDRTQYSSVKINDWNDVGGAKVYYLSKDSMRISKIRELILKTKPDAIYVNSYFATPTIFALKLRKLKLIPNINIIVAPCGELSDGALQLKPGKKKLFIGFSKLSRLYGNVVWKASNDLEQAEIERIKSGSGKIFIAPDLPPKTIFDDYNQEAKPKKIQGEARMIFLSRFMKKKNFKWLLEFISSVKGNLSIDVYGPIEAPGYWQECEEIIKTLPPNIKIEAKGSIPFERVLETLFNYHFFILPTLGENFGHVFLEALAAGCPLIISDRTPWLDLEKDNIGWALPLEKREMWIETLNHCIALDDETYSELSKSARSFACRWLARPENEADTISVLNYSLSNALNGAG